MAIQNGFGPLPGGSANALNITAPTVIKAAPGSLISISVVVAGTVAGVAYDSTSTSGNTVANEIGVIPTTVGFIQSNFRFQNGLVIAPGTGQTIAVSYF